MPKAFPEEFRRCVRSQRTSESPKVAEQTQLAPAYELLESAFGAFNDAADTMTSRVMYSSLDS